MVYNLIGHDPCFLLTPPFRLRMRVHRIVWFTRLSCLLNRHVVVLSYGIHRKIGLWRRKHTRGNTRYNLGSNVLQFRQSTSETVTVDRNSSAKLTSSSLEYQPWSWMRTQPDCIGVLPLRSPHLLRIDTASHFTSTDQHEHDFRFTGSQVM